MAGKLEEEHILEANLRQRALQRLTGRGAPDIAWLGASAALRTLFELASSPSTAADALALLHELQVHQVELDLQSEELRNASTEMEAALRRQTQLYDFAPVGCFTVDGDTTLLELNLAGARLLGSERDALLGQALDGFVSPPSRDTLRTLLDRADAGSRGEACIVQLHPFTGSQRPVLAMASIDPEGGRFLVALVDSGGQGPAQVRPPHYGER
jgi:PAS domain S-box-containing protein